MQAIRRFPRIFITDADLYSLNDKVYPSP